MRPLGEALGLGSDRPVLLDGAKGTELQRLGVAVTDPWWTTAALLTEADRTRLAEIHRSYTRAGADLVTALTFRTNRRALQRAGAGEDRSRELVRTAVEVARSATDTADTPVLAASVTAVEDCYQPRLVPPDADLREEHGWLAARLAEAGVGLVLAETINSAREAVAVAAACTEQGLPVWVGFVCTSDGRLLSGESIGTAARQAAAAGAGAVLVNCSTPADTDAALEVLSADCPVPIGAYPNLEDRSDIADWVAVDRYVPVRFGPEEFAELMAERVRRYGLSVVGGCCGSTPAHIAALRSRLAPARRP
ncbi:homocysteine S-methyltransferase family protein [Kitasatospora sp. HPMI-4]|uniref:homocysteine S-methyltransferase family protein n=1 Tax=Kitasatospora sp. HPMI-4 TaxID=3448443 RepID=UPI003F1B39C5